MNSMFARTRRSASLETIIDLGRDVPASFEVGEEKAPDDEYAHISEAQMFIRVLDYAG